MDFTSIGLNEFMQAENAPVTKGPGAYTQGGTSLPVEDSTPRGIHTYFNSLYRIGGSLIVGTVANPPTNNDPNMRSYFIGSNNAYFGVEVINRGLGGTSTADFVAIAGTPATGNTGHFVDVGMTGPSWNDSAYAVFDKNSGYLFDFADNLYISTGTAGTINFSTNGFTTKNNIRASIDPSGNFFVGQVALATNATDGFLHIPSCAGAPTGTPTIKTGLVPMVYDSSNNELYIYSSGWRKVGTML